MSMLLEIFVIRISKNSLCKYCFLMGKQMTKYSNQHKKYPENYFLVNFLQTWQKKNGQRSCYKFLIPICIE